jgi:hypothetical protein
MRLLVTKYEILVTKYEILVTKYEILVTKYEILVTKYEILVTKYDILVAKYDILYHFCVHINVRRNKFLFNKTNRRTIFQIHFLSRNSTCFGQFLCPSSGVFHCTFSTGICHAGLMTAFMHEPFWSCLKAVVKPA